MCIRAGEKGFTLEWIERDFTEKASLAWGLDGCIEVCLSVWEH